MLSIIICSVDDARFAAVSTMFEGVLRGESFEIIRVSDARSMCEGYTRGIARSVGEQLILCHDDIEILNADFAQRLKQHLSQFDLMGVAGTNRLTRGKWAAAGPPYIFGQIAQPHKDGGFLVEIYGVHGHLAAGGIQAMDGVFLAARRRVVEQIPFDAATFNSFHHYDLDFSFAAYLAGFNLGIANDIHILHQSHGAADEKWLESNTRFYRKYARHLSPSTPRNWSFASVQVRTKQEAAELMADAIIQPLLTPPVRI